MVKRLSNPQVTVQTTAPTNPKTGDVWIDADEEFTGGGEGGFIAQPNEPDDTTVLWYDTDEDTGQSVDSRRDILDSVYPVGSQYSNFVNPANPSIILSMPWTTWVAVQGRVVVGLDPTQTEFDTAGETGGEKSVALVAANNGPHSHGSPSGYFVVQSSVGAMRGFGTNGVMSSSQGDVASGNWGGRLAEDGGDSPLPTASSGSGTPHNNLQPYIVAYVWQRTA